MKNNKMKKTSNLPQISIIVLNWNGKKYIRKCLKSIFNSNYPKDKLEVIVVDNASIDGSDRIVENEFPSAILIKNSKNLGFCKANNIGIKRSTGDIIVLLNNDTFVDKNWLIEIIKAMNKSNVGVVGCRLLYPNGKVIQSCGCKEIFLGYWEHIAAGLRTEKFDCEDEFEVDYVSGAALAIKRKVLESIGLLDSSFWAYVEDVDLCYRAKRAGYKVVIAPKAIVYHYGSASWRKFPLKQLFLQYRNRIIFIWKNYKGICLLRYFLEYPILLTLTSLRNFLRKETTTQKLAARLQSKNILRELFRKYLLNLLFFYITLGPGLLMCRFSGLRVKR